MTKQQQIETVLRRQTVGEICAFGKVEVTAMTHNGGQFYMVRVPGFHRDFASTTVEFAARRIAGLPEARDFFRQFPNG